MHVVKYLAQPDFDLSSRRFAELSAAVLLNAGFRVLLYPEFVHTPMVAFGTKKMGCVAGIMVTASHNPKEDDGYKVYWTNGDPMQLPMTIAEIEQQLEGKIELRP